MIFFCENLLLNHFFTEETIKMIFVIDITVKIINMTKFTSIKNISASIVVFLSSPHTASFTNSTALLNELSNSKDVYGIEPDAKMTKRHKTIKKTVHETVAIFVEMFAGMVESFPTELSTEVRNSIMKVLWDDFVKRDGLFDRLKPTPKNKQVKPVFNKSAYMYFCDEHRSPLKIKNPDMSPSEQTKELAKAWNIVKMAKDTEHAKFVKMASDNKVVDVAKKTTVTTPVNKSPKKKSPRDNYMSRMKVEFAEELSGKSRKDQDIQMKEWWNSLSTTEKDEYKKVTPAVVETTKESPSKKDNFFRSMRTELIGFDEYDGKSQTVKDEVILGRWNDLEEFEKDEYALYEPTNDSIRIEKELLNEQPTGVVDYEAEKEKFIADTKANFVIVTGLSGMSKEEEHVFVMDSWCKREKYIADMMKDLVNMVGYAHSTEQKRYTMCVHAWNTTDIADGGGMKSN
jgi:hypothetical protein